MKAGDSFEGFQVSGRGGTRFDSVMQWASEQDAELILFYTDGETASWGEAPGCPVIVMGAPKSQHQIAKCPYGTPLVIDLD